MGYDKEVEMIRIAKEKSGLLAAPYCFDEDKARRTAGAGANVVVAHLGLATSGSIGSGSGTMQAAQGFGEERGE